MKVLKTKILYLIEIIWYFRMFLIVCSEGILASQSLFISAQLYFYIPIGVGDSDVDEVTDVVIDVDDIDDDSGNVIRLLIG